MPLPACPAGRTNKYAGWASGHRYNLLLRKSRAIKSAAFFISPRPKTVLYQWLKQERLRFRVLKSFFYYFDTSVPSLFALNLINRFTGFKTISDRRCISVASTNELSRFSFYNHHTLKLPYLDQTIPQRILQCPTCCHNIGIVSL